MTAQSGLGFSGIVAIQIPDDGATGEVLTKLTADNYDYDWAPGGGGGGAPTDAEYVVMSLNGTLTDERVLTAGTGITLVDGGAGGAATISVDVGALNLLLDHGLLLGLADDDHLQYLLLAGRAGGQDAIGGTASGELLTLHRVRAMLTVVVSKLAAAWISTGTSRLTRSLLVASGSRTLFQRLAD